MSLHPDYCTTAELKLVVASTSTADDAFLGNAITAASRAIDTACDRQFGVLTVAAARYYTPFWRYDRYAVDIDDLSSITSLVVKSDLDDDGTYETTLTGMRAWPLNATSDAQPFTQLVFALGTNVWCRQGSLEVTGLWGWTAVPDTIKAATLLQASRFFKRKDAPFGVAGSDAMGNSLRLLAKADPDVEVMVAAYKHWRVS